MKKNINKLKQIVLNPINRFKSATLKKKIFVIVALLIGLIITSNVIQTLTKKPPYTTAKVDITNITESVSETGSITANGTTEVYSPTNGVVTKSNVSNGDYIAEGQELFVVQSSATEQQADAAYSTYLTAQATLNAAESSANTLRAAMYSEWDTFRNLATNGTYENGDDTPNTQNRTAAEFQIAQDEWLAAEKKYKDQVTAIAQAKAQVASTWLLYQATQDAIVKAPVAGKISNLSIKVGSPVKASATSITSTLSPVLLISNGDTASEIGIEISETDIAKIKSGQKAEADISAVSNKKYDAEVTRVDEIGTIKDGVIVYNVYLNILNPDNNLRSGMNADVKITTKEVKNVLSVPSSAIKPYQGGKAVRVPDKKAKDGIKYIPVIAGIRGEDRTEIVKGLTKGQEIITSLSNEKIKRTGLFGN